jgi:hypothetical protein
MRTRTIPSSRFLAHAGTVLGALLLAASVRPVQAQGTSTDPRWDAWLGCWEAADASGLRVIGSPTAPLVCVTPAAGTSAVDIVTVADGKVLNRTHVDANGERRATTKDGCTGWESAVWARSASRVYVRSEYSCPGGVTRSSNGLIALSPKGEWLDVQNVALGKNKAVRVVRMHEATNVSRVPAEVIAPLQSRTLVSNASRVAAGAALTGDDLVDAAKNVDGAVVEAWLVERDQGFALDAGMLTKLADAGLPDSVIDVMVALSYPKAFTVNPETRTGELRAPEGQGVYGRGRSLAVVGYDPMGYPLFGYGSYYGMCTRPYSPFYDDYMFGYSSYRSGCGYGYGLSGYGYGYGGFGFGYGFGYGYPYGYGPVVIVQGGGNNLPPGERPRVVKGRGYTQGSSGRTGSTSPAPSSSSGSGTSSTTSTTSSSAAPARTAHPKP